MPGLRGGGASGGIGLTAYRKVNVRLPRYSPAAVDHTNQGSGCGLGLSIVREIMLRHGGDVVLHAVEPHGLAVVMALPVVGAAGAGRVS